MADPALAPLGWFEPDGGRAFEVESARLDLAALRDFLGGRSDRFLLDVESARAADCNGALAQQNLILNDLVLLEEFYRKGPLRNRQINGNRALVTPEELADWLAVASE